MRGRGATAASVRHAATRTASIAEPCELPAVAALPAPAAPAAPAAQPRVSLAIALAMLLTMVVLPSMLLALPRLTASLALPPACHVSPPQLPASCTLHSIHSVLLCSVRGPWCTAHRLKERPPGSFICATLWRPCFCRNVPSSSRLLATALSAAGTAAVREKHGSICSSGAAEVKVRSSRSGSEVVAGASLERVTSHTCVNMLFLVEKVESRPNHAIVLLGCGDCPQPSKTCYSAAVPVSPRVQDTCPKDLHSRLGGEKHGRYLDSHRSLVRGE